MKNPVIQAANYKVLCWHGYGNGTLLTPIFEINQIYGKRLIIKRIKFHYYAASGVDPYYRVKATHEVNGTGEAYYEFIPLASRITDIQGLEVFGEGLKPEIKINDVPLGLFTMNNNPTNFGFPLDLDIDNINYEFPSPVESIDLSAVFSMYDQTPSDGSMQTDIKLKVIMEVYLK